MDREAAQSREAGFGKGGRIAPAELARRLVAIADDPAAPLAGCAAALIENGEVVFEGCAGLARIASAAGGPAAADQAMAPDSLFRAASVSKPFSAVLALVLAETGLFDLDADLSPLLGFSLRDPRWPEVPINAAMLLSHTSNLRDDDFYSLPFPVPLGELLAPEGALYDGERRFAAVGPGGRAPRPGTHYEYCNLGFGVLASALEAATGTRFDRLARKILLEPWGFEASYNVLDLADDAFARLGTCYRKLDAAGGTSPRGTWTAQIDAYGGLRPAFPCRTVDGARPEQLERYVPGSNGTLFSPQGGLRLSLRGLERLCLLVLGGGVLDGRRALSPASAALLTTPRWVRAADDSNGVQDHNATWASAAGLQLIETAPGGRRAWGHRADAYGLRGGFLLDAGTRSGYAYLINGVSRLEGRDEEAAVQELLARALGWKA